MESFKNFEKAMRECVSFDDADFRALFEAARKGLVGVACSGGADSMFLLCACVALLGSDKIAVLHFNHRVRKAAELDENMVRKFCAKNNLRLVVQKASSVPKKITEESLRKMRLDFYGKNFEKLGLSAIAQGHHLGDACETVIMRLARGSNLEGMCSPRSESSLGSMRFIRPLLNFEKSEMKRILKKCGIVWREDESNADPKFFRNAVRNEIIPMIEKFSPLKFASCVKRSRKLFAEDCDFIDALFEKFFSESNPDFILGKNFSEINLPEEILNSRALLRRALMKLVVKNSLDKSFRANAADAALEKIESNFRLKRCFSLGKYFLVFLPPNKKNLSKKGAGMAKLSIEFADRREVRAPSYEINLKFGKNSLPTGDALIVKKIELSVGKLGQIMAGKVDESEKAYINLAALEKEKKPSRGKFALSARSAEVSDEYQPMASLQKRNISKMLASKKISSTARNRLPRVIFSRGEIAWVPNLPPASKLALDADCAEVIELTFVRQST